MSTRQSPPARDSFEEELMAAMRSFTDEQQPRPLDPANIARSARRSPRRTGLLAAASVAVLATVGGVLAVTLTDGGSGDAQPGEVGASVSVLPSTPPATGPNPGAPDPGAPPSMPNSATTSAIRSLYAQVLAKADPRLAGMMDTSGVRHGFESAKLYEKAWGTGDKLGDLTCGKQGVNGAVIGTVSDTPATLQAVVTLFKGTERMPDAAVLTIDKTGSQISKVECRAADPVSAQPMPVARLYSAIGATFQTPGGKLGTAPDVRAAVAANADASLAGTDMLCGGPVTPFWIVDSPADGTTLVTYQVFTASRETPFRVTVDSAVGKVSQIDCASRPSA